MALSRVQRVIIVSLGFQLLIFNRGARLLGGVAGQGSFMSVSDKTFQISFLFALAVKAGLVWIGKMENFRIPRTKKYLTALAIVLSRLRLCSYLRFNLWNYEDNRVTTIRVT